MSVLKDEAKKLIEQLPEHATWDGLLYEFYVKARIAEGLKAIEEGRTVSHKEAKNQILSK